jgi:hypothetical protein
MEILLKIMVLIGVLYIVWSIQLFFEFFKDFLFNIFKNFKERKKNNNLV